MCVRQFEREVDAGERGAHRAAEDRAHADRRPEAGTLVREEERLDAAQRAADHQQGGQDAARGARARRTESPRNQRLGQGIPSSTLPVTDPGEQRADGVVADAERLWGKIGRRCQ